MALNVSIEKLYETGTYLASSSRVFNRNDWKNLGGLVDLKKIYQNPPNINPTRSKTGSLAVGNVGNNKDTTSNELQSNRFLKMTNIKFSQGRQYQASSNGQSTVKNQQNSDTGVVDTDWISSRFMTPSKYLKPIDRVNRYFSSTGWKHTSTRLGHHMACNPRPQFTRFADIKGNNRAVSNNAYHLYGSAYGTEPIGPKSGGLGMGRYYSEAIDDNATTIFLEFGVPKFNSLIDFFTRATSYEDQAIANYGRIPAGYSIGKVVGYYVQFCAFPLVSLTIYATKFIFGFLFGGPFKFYYLSPAMHVYWSSVSLLVSQLATELGILSPFLMDKENEANKIGIPIKLDQADLQDLAQYFPGMIHPFSNYLDVFAVVTAEQQLSYKLSKIEYKKYLESDKLNKYKDPEYWRGYAVDSLTEKKVRPPGETFWNKVDVSLSFEAFVLKMTGEDPDGTANAHPDIYRNYKSYSDAVGKMEASPDGKYPSGGLYSAKSLDSGGIDGKDENGNTIDLTTAETYTIEKTEEGATTNSSLERVNNDKSDSRNKFQRDTTDGSYNLGETSFNAAKQWLVNFGGTFDSVIRDGGSYAIFNVDYQGTTSESFSNSYSDIELGGGIKSIAQGARNMKFNLAGGSLGQVVDSVKDQVFGFLNGVADSVSYGLSNVLRTLTGGGYVDIPKKWDDSDINLPTITYHIDLVSPYGNIISQMQNIYIPLCMLMAGTLPLAAGQASYTSPFLCSCFNKGVQDIKLGMITSLSISRGTTNLPYSRNKRALSYSVDFTVTDFSTRLTAPVNSSIFQSFNLSLDDDTPTSLYLSTLASRDLYTNKYFKSKAKMKVSRMMMAVSQSVSPASMSMRAAEWVKPVLAPFVSEKRLNQTQNNSDNYF